MRATLGALLIAGALAIAVLTPQPTRADFKTDQNLCFGTGSSTDFAVRVAACTRQIESGRWQGRNLAITYLNRGNLYKANGAYDQAIADYDEAIRLDPKYVKAYNNRGLAWMMKGAFDRAIADLNQAIRFDPKYEDAFVNRGGVYYRKGNYANAVADYAEAVELAPSDVEALYWRGKAKLKNGDATGGEADIAAARKINPKFAPVAVEPKTSGTGETNAQDHSPAPAPPASPLDSIAVAPGTKVLQTETLTVGANGTSGNVQLAARGVLTIDYAVGASAEIRLAVITGEQFQQAATGHKVTPGGLLNVVIHGVGSRSVTLERGTYAVVFIQPNPPNAVITYRASYRRTN